MTEQQSPGRQGSGAWKFVVVILLLLGAYQLTMHFVRKHVDQQIEGNVGEQLVEFELEDLDGVRWSPSKLRGKKVVFNFFRSHCQGCRIEAPVVRELVRRIDPEKVQVIGILVDRVQGFSEEATTQTLVDFGYEHPVLIADEQLVDAFHGVGWSNVTPVTYIIDEKGRVAASFRGHQELEPLLAALE